MKLLKEQEDIVKEMGKKGGLSSSIFNGVAVVMGALGRPERRWL